MPGWELESFNGTADETYARPCLSSVEAVRISVVMMLAASLCRYPLRATAVGISELPWLNANAPKWCTRASVRLGDQEKLREARSRRDLDHHQPALSMPAHCFDDGE